ncbi:MAG TPA: glycosyltransferase family 2 protein [Candidatus Saccharimonadales bacterium]|nr:glycosyltransferase family 2 protein [Candidatus Saccharimonadales bacterium]
MAKKISVIIPNYNGEKLLAKNLPQVFKNTQGAEIIVVDDASTDNSVNLVKEEFGKVKVIEQQKNGGFAHSVNTGVKAASGDLVLLLNSDVAPTPGFLKPATDHFKDSNLFAVGLMDLSHEDGKVINRGRGGAKFQKGFLMHFAMSNESGETLWVSGGSSLIDKKKFLELGGFDEIYAPFYWEDIDLGYRAQKEGYICIFEPKSQVEHYHQEGAIKKNFSPSFVKTTSYRNQFLFVWKNISDYQFLIEHLMWLPINIAKSFIALDWPFLLGFTKALFKLPQLVFNYQQETVNDKLSDKEIIKKFEKP